MILPQIEILPLIFVSRNIFFENSEKNARQNEMHAESHAYGILALTLAVWDSYGILTCVWPSHVFGILFGILCIRSL